MRNKDKSYPSKVLLFGEYSIIDGSSALAAPLKSKQGQWKLGGKLQSYGYEIFEHLRSTFTEKDFNFDGIARDIEQGLFFDCNIPTGYGLGSSGSLSAALLDAYAVNPPSDMKTARTMLSQIEEHFHGTSSGMDPLVSYFNAPVLKSKGEFSVLDTFSSVELLDDYYLLDTEVARNTKVFVEIYNKLKKNETHQKGFDKIAQLNNRIVQNIVDQAPYRDELETLSYLQWQYFQPMIHDRVKQLWEHSLTHKDFSLKLCGAGGGGYFLIKIWNREVLEELTHTYKLESCNYYE